MRELEILKSIDILKDDDFSFLTSVASELSDTLRKRQMFRTETEMVVSVLDDVHFPTKASKYWQAVREQAVMFEQLMSTSFQYRKNEVKLKRAMAKRDAATDVFDREEADIEIDECLFARATMEMESRDRIREIRLWSQIKKDLNDGSFDTQDVNTHQLASYAKRFILQASNAPGDMPVAEANNLMGQLSTSIKELSQRGVLNEVLDGLPDHVIDRVLVNTGIVQKLTVQSSNDHVPQAA